MAIANDITSAVARPQTLVDDWPQLARSDDWAPGQQIGPYLLKQRLGKGGMGVVWLAEQLQPLQREVAIKVMTGERRDAWAETWFEIERQALAQLSHRGIAQIFDAGRLPDGALFFAMEYVPGVPLDEFQQQHPLQPGTGRAVPADLRGGAARAPARPDPSRPEAAQCTGATVGR